MTDQKKVVFEYLSALLSDPQASETHSEESLTESAAASHELAEVVSVDEMSAVISTAAEPEPEPEPEPVNAVEANAEPVLRCMLVSVQGLKLAIPLEEIDTTYCISSISLEIDTKHDWLIGQFERQGLAVRVVDTGLWIIPDTYSLEASGYHDLIVLSGGRWALACNEILSSVDLPCSAINLNQDTSRRAWLKGTCLAQRCAVMDTRQLMDEFEVMVV